MLNDKIILDATAQGADSSYIKDLSFNFDLKNEVAHFNGQLVTVSLNNKEIITPMPTNFSFRLKELKEMLPGQPTGTTIKMQQKVALAENFTNQIKAALSVYLAEIFALEHPAPEAQEEDENNG